jgi:hypothetical protein
MAVRPLLCSPLLASRKADEAAGCIVSLLIPLSTAGVAAVGWTAGDDSLRPSVRTFEVAAIPTRSLKRLFDGPEAWLKGGN